MKKLKVQFVIRPAKHQINYTNWFSAGLHKHGIKDIAINPAFDPNHNSDLVVCWAHKRHNIFQYQKQHNRRYMIMERAYIGERHHWVSLGYDGLNGRADFCNQDITSSKRWDKYFLDYIKPQRTYKNGYALVIGQVPGDASHKHININKWYETTIRSLNKKGVPVVFRAHPLARQNNVWQPAADLQFKYDKNPSLEASLKGARCCVTFSSNSGVISMLEGVPTVAYDEGSMVYNIAENDLNNIDNTPDRTDWARKLAYCQWLPAELESGEAWEHLKQGMEEN